MSSDWEIYLSKQGEQEKSWEALCVNCGACCGVFENDPCVHLKKEKDKYFCTIYKDRRGSRKTINGNEFECVDLRRILHKKWPGDEHCAYKKFLRDDIK